MHNRKTRKSRNADAGVSLACSGSLVFMRKLLVDALTTVNLLQSSPARHTIGRRNVRADNNGLAMKKILIGVMLVVLSSLALAHSGGTDSVGCHMDYRTGIWHCH